MSGENRSAAQGTLQFRNAADCRQWLARLPLANTAICHAALAQQVGLIPACALAPAERLEVLELLRDTVASVQADHAAGFRGKPLPLEAGEREHWRAAVGLWRAMAEGYESLIDAMAGAAPELAAQAALICERALACTALAMDEHHRTYHAVPAALWRQLNRLYAFAESAGVAGAAVSDPVGRAVPATSCAGTYARALLAAAAQPDALTVEEMDTVARWLERWENLVRLSPAAAGRGAAHALAVDLASSRGAGLARELAGEGVRYLELEALGKSLRQAAAALKKQDPGSLGLGNLPRAQCEKLLLMLHVQWCAAGTGRVDERTPASAKVMICPSLASMHFHLTGKAFRQPGGELTAAERQRLDMLGLAEQVVEREPASQRSAAAETWTIVNQSLSGLLATCRESEVANRIAFGQLVGLAQPARKIMHLGVVRRLVVDEQGVISIGLRVVPGAPQAAAARIAERGATGPYERA
ncbi:MAG TPA: hypothetical protein VNK67_06065, partial [Burkholderiales bacterium]|nr:hypothetical protein [Burkholderiales bacterium]